MKRFLMGCGIVLLLASPLTALELRVLALDSRGAFPCDGNVYRGDPWWNTGRPIRVRISQIWMGMTGGTKADFVGAIQRLPEDETIQYVGWDHYAEPTGPSNYTMNFSPDWILVPTGGGLQTFGYCVPFGGYQPPYGHVAATIWYTM